MYKLIMFEFKKKENRILWDYSLLFVCISSNKFYSIKYNFLLQRANWPGLGRAVLEVLVIETWLTTHY